MKKEYKYSFLYFLYFLVYYPWYLILEKNVIIFHPMNSQIDNLVPYCKYFIIPYIAWFFYVGISYVYFYKKDKESFVKMASFLTIGMTISMLICTIYPNGLLNFRPIINNPKDIFDYLVLFIHNSDTSTNVFPSIHVYNSIGVNYAIQKYNRFKNNQLIHNFSKILCLAICLSTVLLKQHAIIDVLGAILLAKIIHYFIYEQKSKKIIESTNI